MHNRKVIIINSLEEERTILTELDKHSICWLSTQRAVNYIPSRVNGLDVFPYGLVYTTSDRDEKGAIYFDSDVYGIMPSFIVPFDEFLEPFMIKSKLKEFI